MQEVIDAQEEWGQGIVETGEVHSSGGDCIARATEHLDTLYAYDIGVPVLFKPTLAAEDPFPSLEDTHRVCRDEFVGHPLTNGSLRVYRTPKDL
mgnify:CR=1 FL=1